MTLFRGVRQGKREKNPFLSRFCPNRRDGFPFLCFDKKKAGKLSRLKFFIL